MNSRSWLCLCASLLSALAVYYSHVALHPLYILPFFVFVPIFISLLRVEKFREVLTLSMIFSSSCGFLAFYGAQSYGVLVYISAVLIVSIVYLSSLLLIVFFLKKDTSIIFQLAAAAGFVLIDFAASRMPWFATARIAGMLSFDPMLIQLASITGHLGLSFAVVLINISISVFLAEAKLNLRKLSPAIVGISFVYLFGYFSLRDLAPERGEYEFAIIQGSVTDQEYDAMESSETLRRMVFERYFSLSAEAVKNGHKVILWPETAIRSFVGAKEQLISFIEEKGVQIFGGFPFIIENSEKQFNSVLWLDENGKVVSRYNKNYLIPYSENEFISGRQNTPVVTPFGRITTPICFEVLFPRLVRESIADGGESIFVFSNDSGFGQSPVSALMVRQAILRAVENRRWLIRVGQNGISAEVTPHGIINQQSRLFEKIVLPVRFNQERVISFYTKYGDWFIILLLIFFAVGAIRKQS